MVLLLHHLPTWCNSICKPEAIFSNCLGFCSVSMIGHMGVNLGVFLFYFILFYSLKFLVVEDECVWGTNGGGVVCINCVGMVLDFEGGGV